MPLKAFWQPYDGTLPRYVLKAEHAAPSATFTYAVLKTCTS
jgi:hypothetical protein